MEHASSLRRRLVLAARVPRCLGDLRGAPSGRRAAARAAVRVPRLCRMAPRESAGLRGVLEGGAGRIRSADTAECRASAIRTRSARRRVCGRVRQARSGRPAEIPRIESLVGPCVNNLPVRVTATPAESLLPWLARLQRQQFELAEHQYAPLERIQKWAQVPWRYRLFDSLIVFQNYQVDEAARRLGPDARLVPVATPEATNYPLTVSATPNGELRLRLIYHRDRLAPAAVRTYAADLTAILQTI